MVRRQIGSTVLGMRKVAEAVLRQHHVLVASDNAFQQRARLLQALWREAQGLPMGAKSNGEPLGSRIPLDFAKLTLAHFLSDTIRESVRREIASVRGGSNQLIAEERLYANLLSSQPLCFNLFGELQANLAFASRVCASLWPDRVAEVTAVRFEYSPSRSDDLYTGDKSAFDVFIEHRTLDGAPGFIGIEVKYHESLNVAPAEPKPRYAALTAAMGCFDPSHLAQLKAKPLEQIWRDHMLAGAMLLNEPKWKSGLYVFVYPQDNTQCERAVKAYSACLTDSSSFGSVTLEKIVAAISMHTDAEWVRSLAERYLAWQRVAARIA